MIFAPDAVVYLRISLVSQTDGRSVTHADQRLSTALRKDADDDGDYGGASVASLSPLHPYQYHVMGS